MGSGLVDPPEGGPYGDVRRKLVERGYLDGRIERFVLRDLRSASGRWSGLSRAGFRAALLGGPILGGLLAAAAATANRPVLEASDHLVLWLYFSVLAGAGVFLLAFAAALIVASLAGRRGARRADSLRASFLVGLPTLGYLLLIWWQRRSGGAWLAADALFVVAALVSTLFVAWLAGLVSLAGIIGRTGQVPDRTRGRVRALVLVLLPLVVATLLVRSATERDASGPISPTPFEVSSGAGPLLFVGIDGLDASLLGSLEGRGAEGGLLDSKKRGACFPLGRPAGIEPAEVWTTLMTGMPPETHGVRGAGAERLPWVAASLRTEGGPALLEAALRFLLPTRTVPASGAARRVRTLWEITDLKLGTAAVGFWSSWPAPEPDGDSAPAYVVTDRVVAKLLSGGKADRDTSPESLYGSLAARFPAERAEIRREFEAWFPSNGERERRLAWESFLIDAYHVRTTRRLAKDERVRASFVYLPGLDILRQRLGERFDLRDAGGALASTRVLERYLAWLDGVIAVFAAERLHGTMLLLADPGRSAAPRVQGFVIVTGEAARAGCAGASLGALDVAPLLLSLAGFPRSAEMSAKTADACLLLPQPGPAPIASYGRRGASPGAQESDYDVEMVERLRSLGYLR